MNLECLNDIITDNLAIHIDLTDVKSWLNWNTGLTAFSLTKWNGAISNNINLIDFGLTGFDNGRTNIMWSGITVTPKDTYFTMYRVGFNEVHNPTTGETSGVTATTFYYPISAITSGDSENYYFDLTGGYLQGFFKLQNYNYELFPSRYNNGITIETIVYLYPDSHGIFFMMGARAEDKYNPYFSGETITGTTTVGVVTSEDNYLDAIRESEELKTAFIQPEEMMETVYSEIPQVNNIRNNVIAFELTQDKRIAYKYINNEGLIITNSSSAIVTATGFTMIDIAFTPDIIFNSPAQLECAPQRTGKLIFYINGRAMWIVKDFPEFYFHAFNNDGEKEIGAPYSISWGGGSFGLKHSWHYDYQTYVMYDGQDTDYITSKFLVEPDPIPTECYIAPTGDTYLAGLSLSADSTTFKYVDECDSNIEYPLTVMRIQYTGGTGNTYFIKFNQPISVLSNRDYNVNLLLYNDDFFSGDSINKVSILMYSDVVDINVIKDIEYMHPITSEYIASLLDDTLHPWGDGQEYQYSLDGVLYYGDSGLPVTLINSMIVGYGMTNYGYYGGGENQSDLMTGDKNWLPMYSTFRIPDNTGQKEIFMGLLIQTDDEFNINGSLYINGFTYTAADILVQDERKDDLTVQQNFDSGFIGGIQKLRIYDRAFTSPEILHNALIEREKNSNIIVSKGGRIIYR